MGENILDVAGSVSGDGGRGEGDINESFDTARDKADLVVPESVPVLPSIHLQGAQEGGDNNVTPSLRATILRRAESGMKGQKTKNSTNKNKERTSIAGAIVKLLEKQESGEQTLKKLVEKQELVGENAGVSAHMSANMTMMMMRQMEAMNKSMDRRDKRERRRERKERKRRKRRRAKKKAKKRAKMLAAAELDDHGGKAGQRYSSSTSDSDSSTTDYGDSDTSSSLSDQDSE